MKTLWAFVCVLPLVAALSISAQDEEKEQRIRKFSPEDYKKLAKLTSYTGKVTGVGAKTVTFRVDDSDYQNKLKWAQGLPSAAQQKTELSKIEAQYAAVKFALGKEFELEFAPKASLRKVRVPFEYDDKGNPKKYSAADLAKLKGAGNLPGYIAKAEDFTPGSMATATFGPRSKDGKPTVTMLIVDNKVD
jgi:hypothetical protein